MSPMFVLALRSIGNRRLSVALTVIAVALSVALLLAHRQLRGRASENIAPQIEALGKARKLCCGRRIACAQPCATRG